MTLNRSHKFEIWEEYLTPEGNHDSSYAGNRFSNLQTAALTVVIRSDINRLVRAKHFPRDGRVVHLQLRFNGLICGLSNCREFLKNGYQLGGNETTVRYIPRHTVRPERLDSLDAKAN